MGDFTIDVSTVTGTLTGGIWMMSTTLNFDKVMDNVKVKEIKELMKVHNKDDEILYPVGVLIEFENGDKQKAVVQGDDWYDYETGVAICLFKELLCRITGEESERGTYLFNKLVKEALKSQRKFEEEQEKEEELQALIKHRRDKRFEKKKKRAEREAEKQIEIQKEAYIRAMKELGTN